MFSSIKTSFYILVVSLFVGFYYDIIPFQYLSSSAFNSNNSTNIPTFTKDSLKLFNGVEKEPLYISILGNVFDVSKGRRHYEQGATYNFFVGKDASRAFVSGDFHSAASEDVLDLPCDDLLSLRSWLVMYQKQYVFKGSLIGSYYDKNGAETDYNKSLQKKLSICDEHTLHIENLKMRHPPCNVEWEADRGSRVWCTTKSGGITRNWAGVPRQLYMPGEDAVRCVCVDPNATIEGAILKEYAGCPPASSSCDVPLPN